MDGSAFFSIDAPIFSAQSQRLPNILNSTAPEHKQPQVKVKDCKCHHTGTGSPRNLPFPWSTGGAWIQKWSPLSFLYFPLSAPTPAISALLLDSLSPRNTASPLPAAKESGVDNSASHHGDGCLIWDECYVPHCPGPPLIHQHLLLLSPYRAYISALNASWFCCLLEAIRDCLFGKADGYLV